MRPRISGSTDIQRFFTCTSPGAGAGTDTVASSKLSALGAPTRRFFRRISRDSSMIEDLGCSSGSGVRAVIESRMTLLHDKIRIYTTKPFLAGGGIDIGFDDTERRR